MSDLDHSSRMDSDFAPEGQEADAAMELMRAHRHDDGWTWRSFLRRGRLEWDAATETFRVVWGDVRVLHANTGRNGRGMELSEIVKFRHLVFALCDITGIVWKVQVADGTIMPRFALADGTCCSMARSVSVDAWTGGLRDAGSPPQTTAPSARSSSSPRVAGNGEKSKPFKSEWATVKVGGVLGRFGLKRG